ncbi:MAG: hypothetical protein ABIZ35_24705 [Capsulimonas sp.]|uniref:hypothetical protein n=1 Tax=Capsulimonas sp. TaxID=2494211 RepID=UPI00326650A4
MNEGLPCIRCGEETVYAGDQYCSLCTTDNNSLRIPKAPNARQSVPLLQWCLIMIKQVFVH